jgi:hypothetical protein
MAIILALFDIMSVADIFAVLSDTTDGGTVPGMLPLLFCFLDEVVSGRYEAIPATWPIFRMMAFQIGLKTMGPIGDFLLSSLRDSNSELADSFSVYFSTLIRLVNSKTIQLESLGSQHLRLARIIKADVRELGGRLLHRIWNSLGEDGNGDLSKVKALFTPHLIGSFLELTLSSHWFVESF